MQKKDLPLNGGKSFFYYFSSAACTEAPIKSLNKG